MRKVFFRISLSFILLNPEQLFLFTLNGIKNGNNNILEDSLWYRNINIQLAKESCYIFGNKKELLYLEYKIYYILRGKNSITRKVFCVW